MIYIPKLTPHIEKFFILLFDIMFHNISVFLLNKVFMILTYIPNCRYFATFNEIFAGISIESECNF